jgi:hypothetical protein
LKAAILSIRKPGRHLLLIPLPGAKFRTYKPLEEETGLFLNFAALETTPEAFLDFAHRYGCLGDAATVGAYFPPGPNRPECDLWLEWFPYWRDEVVWMRHLVGLWKAATAGDLVALAPHVAWEGGKIVYRFPPIDTMRHKGDEEQYRDWRDTGGCLADLPTGPGGQPLFKDGDLVGPARIFLQSALDRAFTGKGQPHHQAAVSPRMLWLVREARPELTYMPQSLLGAMYLQLARAVDGKWNYQRCPVCGRFFQLMPKVNRANRVTCSSTCRTYQYHHRIERARQLHREGMTARAIAKELGTEIDTVKGWIAKGG